MESRDFNDVIIGSNGVPFWGFENKDEDSVESKIIKIIEEQRTDKLMPTKKDIDAMNLKLKDNGIDIQFSYTFIKSVDSHKSYKNGSIFSVEIRHRLKTNSNDDDLKFFTFSSCRYDENEIKEINKIEKIIKEYPYGRPESSCGEEKCDIYNINRLIQKEGISASIIPGSKKFESYQSTHGRNKEFTKMFTTIKYFHNGTRFDCIINEMAINSQEYDIVCSF